MNEQSVQYGNLLDACGDESGLDERSSYGNNEGDDSNHERQINFPINKLYGRERELEELESVFLAVQKDHQSRVIFLGGCSGTGKSALIEAFLRQVYHYDSSSSSKNRKKEQGRQLQVPCISGKFGQITGDPFSAVSQAMNAYVHKLMLFLSSQQELETLAEQLERAEISSGSNSAAILIDTLIPTLETLLQKACSSPRNQRSPSPPRRRGSRGGGRRGTESLNAIRYSFRNLMQALAASQTMPLTFFIDDIQWSDLSSLELLLDLTKDKSLTNVLFVYSHRSNEIDDEHGFTKLMNEVEAERKGTTTRMEIFNLSPESVGQFISDSIHRPVEDISPITEAIYTKTLGNIFFVKQALEELVRKNAIYYDMITFGWEFRDVSRVALENVLSEKDVVQMVRSKLRTFARPLQRALAVAAFTDNSVDLELLDALLRAESIQMDLPSMKRMMKRAFDEGLVLIEKGNGCHEHSTTTATSTTSECIRYKFAHDRIREAACALVPEGYERYCMLMRISRVLLQKGSPTNQNWMMFSAARNLNSVPFTLTNAADMAGLNLKVGIIAISKGAFNEALGFLRAGVEHLDPVSCWDDSYHLTLSLKNNLMETEHVLGNEVRALELAQEIVNNAAALQHKSRAHCCYIEVLAQANNNNYDKSVDAALEILKFYGIDVPKVPTDAQLVSERFRLKQSLRGRSLLCLAGFPIAEGEIFIATMRIAVITIIHANFGKRSALASFLGHRMLREAVDKQKISIEVPSLVVSLGGPLRQQENYQGAFDFATAGTSLLDRFPDEKGIEFTRSKMSLYGTLSCLRIVFAQAVGTFLEMNSILMAEGETELGLASGMLGMYAYINASLPLDTMLERKLRSFREVSSNCGRRTFACVFGLMLQCQYNLRGGPKASLNPVEVNGGVFNEHEALAQFQGAARNMTDRDISMIRLFLSVVFNDETSMEKMLDRLEHVPVYDLPIERQHLRMAFSGVAAFILSKKSEKHLKWGKTCLQFFEKLSLFGSPNAHPVYACLKALDKPSLASYEEAIQLSCKAGLPHLTALMNERCSLMVLAQAESHGTQHEEFLSRAVLCYKEWGALNKVSQLKSQHRFLCHDTHLPKDRRCTIINSTVVLEALRATGQMKS